MVAEKMYVMGEIHLIQTNQGGGLGRKVPPKSRKMTLDSGAQTWEIWTVGLEAPMARARATRQRVSWGPNTERQDSRLTDTVD